MSTTDIYLTSLQGGASAEHVFVPFVFVQAVFGHLDGHSFASFIFGQVPASFFFSQHAFVQSFGHPFTSQQAGLAPSVEQALIHVHPVASVSSAPVSKVFPISKAIPMTANTKKALNTFVVISIPLRY